MMDFSMMDSEDPALFKTLDMPRSCHVLVVDGDTFVAARMVALLQRSGYEVYSADSAAQALQILRLVPCQIVLTNWELADLDGPSLCRKIRARDLHAYTYVMLLSERRNATDVVAGLRSGADDYIAKSVSSAELLARVDAGRRLMRLERTLRVSTTANGRLALNDRLTGANNRRYLMQYLPRELERSRRYRHPLAVLSCDIDQFKTINDRFGHDAGDDVLRAFVARAAACTRNSIDWIARVGGEEFLIILPETNLAAATLAAERVRVAFARPHIATSAGSLRATVSIGVTALETPEEIAHTPLAELIRAADGCLYVSKSSGRDRSTSLAPARAVSLLSRLAAGNRYELN